MGDIRWRWVKIDSSEAMQKYLYLEIGMCWRDKPKTGSKVMRAIK